MAGLKKNFIFVQGDDPLAKQINEKASELFAQLQKFDASALPIAGHLRDYFIQHHLGSRLFFSIQNSAHIIYQSVMKTGQSIETISIADYGAGLGTLYLLAGMLPLKRIVYNDYLPDWKETAAAISANLKIEIDGFVTGDIDEVLLYGIKEGFQFNVIASRNVIEHIYSLDFFFQEIYRHNPSAVIFSTTSANFHNPAMRLKHYLLHKKIEKTQYLPFRLKEIQQAWPEISANELQELGRLTRGKGKKDFTDAIEDYKDKHAVAPVKYLRSNTCICTYGYWCEHLLTRNEYNTIINSAGYRMDFTPGYWDSHYKHPLMNLLAGFLNKIISLTGRGGILLAPFVNIIASKKV